LLEQTPEVALSGDDISLAALSEQMGWPGHSPARDRWVAALRSNPERLVGYSAVFKAPAMARADFMVVTLPSARHRGIGSELLRLVLADASALGASDATCYVSGADDGTPGFLTRRGFAPVAAYVELVAPDASRFPQPAWPEGFVVRSVASEHGIAALVEASNRGYEGLWGHNVSSAENWSHWLTGMDITGISLLFDPAGAVAGIVRAELRERDGARVGVVDAPGVVSEWRGAGLYRPLLLQALSWLAPRGAAEYRIESWGDDPAVIQEYVALGFARDRQDTLYRRRLADDGA
ncbi:MAG TPA: GNAT family N-acetyltransferase, partial [Ktedonobacterales bacterium]|nr:GNAT family N-acetyltransferase [Ktedonobacterales bacterium]